MLFQNPSGAPADRGFRALAHIAAGRDELISRP